MQDINNSSLEIELHPFDNNRFSSLCGKLDENIKRIEKYFRVNKNKILHLKNRVDRYGGLLALLSWTPIFGDPIALALGFFRTNFYLVSIYMLIGKVMRYLVWAAITYWGISLF